MKHFPSISRLIFLTNVTLILILVKFTVAKGAQFSCSSGNVSCLIAAINKANALPGEHTINLESGIYRLTTVDNTMVDAGTVDARGLPRLTSALTIRGTAATTTIIQREANAPAFGILYVAASGTLTLDSVTIRQGTVAWGGGIRNAGNLTVRRSIISDTVNGGFGAGLFNEQIGTIVIADSTVTNNLTFLSAGGIYNDGGIVTILNSAFTSNTGDSGAGGVLNDDGRITIINSTFAGNVTGTVGGAMANIFEGEVTIQNSTISDNDGGISNRSFSGKVELQNTILANNTGPESDCNASAITSLGNNLFGDVTGCIINLQPSDLVGDPDLGNVTDNGNPGNGHFPPLQTSPAIDAGDTPSCPLTDQIGQPRFGPCDIGAIEFRPGPSVLTVGLDIRPNNPNNNVQPHSNGRIPIAILSTKSFDATTVDLATVGFGPNHAAAERNQQLRDVNRDGLVDMVVQVRIRGSGIECGDTSASLDGQTMNGVPIRGADSITTVGCKPNKSKKK